MSDIYELNVSMLSARCHDWARCHGNRLSRDSLPGHQCIKGAERWRWRLLQYHLVAGDGAVSPTDPTEFYLAFYVFKNHVSIL